MAKYNLPSISSSTSDSGSEPSSEEASAAADAPEVLLKLLKHSKKWW